MTMNTLLILLLIGGLLAAAKWREGRRKPLPVTTDELDKPLMWWSQLDPFSIRDLLRSISIMGASGSGKTSSIGFQLAKALAACGKVTVLAIASKPEDRKFWEGIAAAAGRELIVFGPGTENNHRFNVIDFESKHGADAREITQCIMTIGETLTRSEGGQRDPFWESGNRRLIHNACEVILQAYGKIDAWDIQRFINDAPLTKEQLSDPTWRQGYYNSTMRLAHDKTEKTTVQAHDFELAWQFWGSEWPHLNDRTRTSILAGVMSILHVFNTGIVRELIGTTTTCSPESLDEGKLILVDMPIANYGVGGAFVAGAMKYAMQRHVLRRSAGQETPATCLWVDEYQNHITSFDAKYLAECRSHYGCMVVLTQSMHSFFSSIGGKEAQSQTKALLTNFGTKAFLTLGDDESAQFASSLIGRSIIRLGGSSMGHPSGVYEEAMGQVHAHSSLSEQFEQRVQNAAFMHGMRCGGPENGFFADAIIIRSGMPFSSGENWMKVAFSQR